MSKRRRRYLSTVFWCLLLILVVKFLYSVRYEGSRYPDEAFQRIPLWFPYELESETPFVESRISIWSDNGLKESSLNSGAAPQQPDAGLALERITKFVLGDGAIGGTTAPLSSAWRESTETHYVIWATNLVSVKIYKQYDRFLEACREYGLDGTQLEDFPTNFSRYWNGPGRTTPWRVCASFGRDPFSIYEILVLLVLLFLVFRSFRNLVKPPPPERPWPRDRPVFGGLFSQTELMYQTDGQEDERGLKSSPQDSPPLKQSRQSSSSSPPPTRTDTVQGNVRRAGG